MKKLFLLVILLSVGCTKQPTSSDPQADLIRKGQIAYQTNCTTCHNTDPSKDGAVGPAVAGSSHALIEARVLHLDYPAAYTPKRTTRAMTAFPQLSGDIDGLAAYLGSIH